MLGDVLAIIENKPQNYLINGDFAIDQRFAGTLNSSLGYGVDRWLLSNGDSSQRVAEVGQPFSYALEVIATADLNTITQRVESLFSKLLVGKTVTFSVKMKLLAGALGGLPHIQVAYADVVDDFSATTLVYNEDLISDAVIDATYRVFKFSFLVTESMSTNGFQVNFGDFSAASNTIRFTQAILNQGDYVANFILFGKNPIEELKACQRYFEKSYDNEVAPGTAGLKSSLGYVAHSTTEAHGTMTYIQPKRIIPVVTTYGNTGAAGQCHRRGVGDTPATVAPGEAGKNTFSTISGGWATGNVLSFNYTADAEL